MTPSGCFLIRANQFYPLGAPSPESIFDKFDTIYKKELFYVHEEGLWRDSVE
jgi:hypothetical protein